MNAESVIFTEEELAAISPDRRDVLERLGRKMRYREIADDLGIKIGTVRSRINRARKDIDRLRAASAATVSA